MINIEIREFSQSITNFINRSPLPIEIKRLCINEISTQLMQAADTQIEAEILERDKQTGQDNPGQEEKNELIKNPSKDIMEEQRRSGD